MTYAKITWIDKHKPARKAYLKTETVAKIEAIGDYLNVAQHTPNLTSPRHKGVYNRKLIIILCLNALSHALDSGMVK